MRISDWSSDVCSSDLRFVRQTTISRTWPDHRCGSGRNPTLRTGRGGRGKSAKQRPGRTDGELVYLYTPIHSRPVARGAIASIPDGFSSEEGRVGKECVSRCRSRWWPYHEKKKK